MQSFENEQWREVSIAPGYQVSDHGRVRRLKILKPAIGVMNGNKVRPVWVRLCPNDGRPPVNVWVSTLVAEAFIGPAPNGHIADHIDGDRRNLHASNIHWVDEETYRHRHKRRSGLVYVLKNPRPPAPRKRKVTTGPTPREAIMIAALQVRDPKEQAARQAKRFAQNAVIEERRRAKFELFHARERRAAERIIRQLQAEAERQEIQARKEEAKRNTRPAISPRVWRGRHEEFAAIWSETPLTIDLRMDGDDAILIDRDGKTRRISPGDLFAAYQGRIVRKAKTPHE